VEAHLRMVDGFRLLVDAPRAHDADALSGGEGAGAQLKRVLGTRRPPGRERCGATIEVLELSGMEATPEQSNGPPLYLERAGTPRGTSRPRGRISQPVVPGDLDTIPAPKSTQRRSSCSFHARDSSFGPHRVGRIERGGCGSARRSRTSLASMVLWG